MWTGSNNIISSSNDTTIKIWDPVHGLKRELKSHAHWVNSMDLSTSYTMRFCFWDSEKLTTEDVDHSDLQAIQAKAKANYLKTLAKSGEVLVSASDDGTLILWDPLNEVKPWIK